MGTDLSSTENFVEAPFIIVKIGEYTFGACSDMTKASKSKSLKVTFPNFMKSLNITKINGTVNTYTIKMEYGITETDDPNLLERVFGSVYNKREITLTYGDWNSPTSIYKEEVALITKVSSSMNVQNSKIEYTIQCVSTALSLKAGSFAFGKRTAKPSDVLKEMLANEAYGLSAVFSGMRNSTSNAIAGLIAGNDKKVQLEAKDSTSSLDYMNYLVNSMVSVNEPSGNLVKQSNYQLAIFDDVSNSYGGTYFKVVEVDSSAQYDSYDTYTVDVGYPNKNFVTSFSVNNDNTWSILYDHAASIKMPEHLYTINRNGDIVSTESATLTKSSTYMKTTEADKTWWTKVTQFPITAKLEIKGLLRPTMLMNYVRVNVYFYGHKHVSSGLYIITKQEDSISSSGYKTTLSLTRIGGDR